MTNLNILSDFNLLVNGKYEKQLWSVHFIFDNTSHLFTLNYLGKDNDGNHIYFSDKKLCLPRMDFQIMVIENEKTTHLNVKFDGSKFNNNKIDFYSDVFQFRCNHHQAVIVEKTPYLFDRIQETNNKINNLEKEIEKLRDEYRELKSEKVDLELKHYFAVEALEQLINKNKDILDKIK